jgi:tRNA/rRNA methyltransferase/tRNA (cytidine32/uridine32-2'-O)-methyltransferase
MKTTDIRFVLVEPSHPGNIGAVARAMKNMALSELALVRPRAFPHAEATARASGADDVLAAAKVFDSLPEALEGCGFVLATTARERDHNYRVMEVREAAARVVSETARGPVAVLFGPERIGLTNSDIDVAHALVRIPGNREYLSLNMAMAAQIVAYEIFLARGAAASGSPADRTGRQGAVPLATAEQMTRLYEHLAQVMEEVEFRDRTQSGTNLMERIHRFLQRAELDQNEANILRGFLTCVQNKRRKAGA